LFKNLEKKPEGWWFDPTRGRVGLEFHCCDSMSSPHELKPYQSLQCRAHNQNSASSTDGIYWNFAGSHIQGGIHDDGSGFAGAMAYAINAILMSFESTENLQLWVNIQLVLVFFRTNYSRFRCNLRCIPLRCLWISSPCSVSHFPHF
jgi:hypothetical protein